MSAVPGLKKKLKSIRTAGKLSKVMKTVSATKFAKLSAYQKSYAVYAEQYRRLTVKKSEAAEETQADTVIVLGSNRGFCGGFNNNTFQYMKEKLLCNEMPKHLIVCGGEIGRIFTDNGIIPEKEFSFGDIPEFAEIDPLYAYISDLADEETDYPVKIVRSFYKNTLTQIPGEDILILHPGSCDLEEDCLWIPDRETVFNRVSEKGFRALLFGTVLETALGAQAATLMAMRSAYDTAQEYSAELENEIHRQRQSDVTADVIETSSERGNKGDETNG